MDVVAPEAAIGLDKTGFVSADPAALDGSR